MHAFLPIPDARRSNPDKYREETAALVRLIREQCPGPNGRRPNMGQVADLLGVSESTLQLHTGPAPKNRRKPILPSYSFIYALRALVAAPAATQRALWGDVPRGEPEDGPV